MAETQEMKAVEITQEEETMKGMIPWARASLPDTPGFHGDANAEEQHQEQGADQNIPLLPPAPPAAPTDLAARSSPNPNIPWNPAARLTVGWLKGVHWKIVPRHLISESHWVASVPGWVELEDFVFEDLDHHFRTGSNITHDATRGNRSSQTSLLDARRTQNVEIMLQSIPIERVEAKASFIAELMQNVMTSRAVAVRNAMLALQQVQLVECQTQGVNTTARKRDASMDGRIISEKLFMEASEQDLLLSTLSMDLIVEILVRCSCVRTILKFACASRKIYKFVYSNVSLWETFYSSLIPRGGQRLSIGFLLNVLEVMLDRPNVFVPTQQEVNAFHWFHGNKTNFSPSNVYFDSLIKWNADCLQSSTGHVSILEFERRISMIRTCFQFQLIQESFCDALRVIEVIFSSPSFLYILYTVRFLGNVMNEFPACGAWSFKLSSLRSLRSLKTADGKSTLIHFLAAFLQVRCPEALKVLESAEMISSAVKRLEASLPKFFVVWRSIKMYYGLENLSPEVVALEEQYVKHYRPKFEEAVYQISSDVFQVIRRRTFEDYDLKAETFLLNAMSNLQSFVADLDHACKSVSSDILNRLSGSVQGDKLARFHPTSESHPTAFPDDLTLLTLPKDAPKAEGDEMLDALASRGASKDANHGEIDAKLVGISDRTSRLPEYETHSHDEVVVDGHNAATTSLHSPSPSTPPVPPPPPPPPPPRSGASTSVAKSRTSGPYETLPCQDIFKKQFRTAKFNWSASFQLPTERSFWSHNFAPTFLHTDLEALEVSLAGMALSDLFREQKAEAQTAVSSTFSPPWYLRGVVVGKPTNQLIKMNSTPALEIFLKGIGRILDLPSDTAASKDQRENILRCPTLTRLEQEIEKCSKAILERGSSASIERLESYGNDSASLLLEGFQIVLGVKYEREEMARLFADDLAKRALNEENMGRVHDSLKYLQTSYRLWPEGPAKVALRTFMTRNPLANAEARSSSFDDLSSFLLDVFDEQNFARLAKKVELLSVCSDVPSLFSELRGLDAVYAEVQTSEPLRSSLRMVLAMGNFLNQHRSNPVEGFTLTSITSFKDIRSRDGRNLYHVLYVAMARYCSEHLDRLLDFSSKLQAASRSEDRCQRGLTGEAVGKVSTLVDDGNLRNLLSEPLLQMCRDLKDCYSTLEERRKASRRWFAVPDSQSVLFLVKEFVIGVASAGRDLRWAQVMHPGGARAIVRNVRSDVWSRINEIDCLQVSLGNRRFSSLAALIVSRLNSRFRLSDQFRFDPAARSAEGPGPSAAASRQDGRTLQVRVVVVGHEEFHLTFPLVARFSEVLDAVADKLQVRVGDFSASMAGSGVAEGEALQDRCSDDRCTLMVNLRQGVRPSVAEDRQQDPERSGRSSQSSGAIRTAANGGG
ncbi:hypothetical protein GUITHDRAFT_133374 [Guillardia theta CCMP2712]|uniref:FH2 domain-containing protein n=1 Tax=Guillardia theta (strain CCMP2712) TaxID=905079 RepID=L1JXN3_GUITC|nr:hypothetical protein GUITHDRAFT_133374 [Guillardia theta CCMP2712]EKX52975.1 hypothetical protein GUITHDRAFT_133374 [Guillardia theta CCMP2712]|eukprot:XP_005839955.1 hypothetical protein GUITHDRAFT_133374 [Guillardia theta CCMP2712]